MHYSSRRRINMKAGSRNRSLHSWSCQRERLSEDDIYALKHLYPLKNTRADTNSSLSKQKRRDVRQKNKKNFVRKLKTVANTPPLKSGVAWTS
ncbi:7546_t:CDS:2 [Rhizophagus irregularis]|nr:7546_t:CDS:2 [Rhizophagus irregularis]